MKIGFSQSGLTINSKKFDPLNLSVRGHGIESDGYINNVDAFEILEGLAACKTPEATQLDKIKALQSVLKKFR
ncbi:MAG: hypothetical protein AB1420_07025 [Bacillota bacterium]